MTETKPDTGIPWAVFIASLFLFPVAIVSLILGMMLAARGRPGEGVLLAVLSSVVLALGMTGAAMLL